MSEGFEFDVEVTVRKRIHVAGPTDRETARRYLKTAIEGLGFGPFAKHDATGHPIEIVISNDFDLVDVEAS